MVGNHSKHDVDVLGCHRGCGVCGGSGGGRGPGGVVRCDRYNAGRKLLQL